MSEEIYTNEEHYEDWKSENLDWLKDEFIEEKIDETTDNLYKAYGSGTGILFGISSDLKPSVRTIVKIVLKYSDFLEGYADDFEAYCRQSFKNRD